MQKKSTEINNIMMHITREKLTKISFRNTKTKIINKIHSYAY